MPEYYKIETGWFVIMISPLSSLFSTPPLGPLVKHNLQIMQEPECKFPTQTPKYMTQNSTSMHGIYNLEIVLAIC